MLKKIRHILSIILLLAALGILAWGVWPGQRVMYTQYVEPQAMQVPSTSTSGHVAVLAIRQVKLEWPESMRIGDQAVVTLVFEPAGGEVLLPPPQDGFSDVYASYALMAEGRLEAAGLRVDPADPRRESLPEGQAVKFSWQVDPQQAATYPSKAWLLLRFLPLQGGQAAEAPVFVRLLDIHATSLLGMTGPSARIFGSLGIVLGLALSYDLLINFVKKTRRTRWTQRK